MYRFNYTFPLILLHVRSPVKRNLRSKNSGAEERVKRTQVSRVSDGFAIQKKTVVCITVI